MNNFFDYEITSDYGTRIDPFTGKETTHNGIDFALPLNTEVKSNVNGVVWSTNYEKDGFGNYVVVFGNDSKLHYYAHLNSASVKKNDYISVGDTLGLSGSTGKSTGPHLHYEVRNMFGTENLNPYDYINDNVDEKQVYTTGVEYIQEKGLTIVGNIVKWITMILIFIFMVFCLYISIDL